MKTLLESLAVTLACLVLGCATSSAVRAVTPETHEWRLRTCVRSTNNATIRRACHIEERDSCLADGLPGNCAEVYP